MAVNDSIPSRMRNRKRPLPPISELLAEARRVYRYDEVSRPGVNLVLAHARPLTRHRHVREARAVLHPMQANLHLHGLAPLSETRHRASRACHKLVTGTSELLRIDTLRECILAGRTCDRLCVCRRQVTVLQEGIETQNWCPEDNPNRGYWRGFWVRLSRCWHSAYLNPTDIPSA